MQIKYEDVRQGGGTSFTAYERKHPETVHPFHFHREIEIASVLGSGGLMFCGSETLQFDSGDIFLLGKNIPHRFILNEKNFEKTKNVIVRVIQFNNDLFGNGFFSLPENILILKMIKMANGALIFKNPDKETHSRFLSVINAEGTEKFILLLSLLNTLSVMQSFSLSPGLSEISAADTGRLSELQDFIEKNYQEKISLNQVSDKLALSRTSFCRYVKNLTGHTFTELLNNYRLTVAAIRLRDTSEKISAISEDSGFMSLSHFNDLFKQKYKNTPSEYREKFSSADS